MRDGKDDKEDRVVDGSEEGGMAFPECLLTLGIKLVCGFCLDSLNWEVMACATFLSRCFNVALSR
jgi:hypothetical protein